MFKQIIIIYCDVMSTTSYITNYKLQGLINKLINIQGKTYLLEFI